jgi:hypothetical protein
VLWRLQVMLCSVLALELMPWPEQGVEPTAWLALLLAGSTGQHMAGRNGLAWLAKA